MYWKSFLDKPSSRPQQLTHLHFARAGLAVQQLWAMFTTAISQSDPGLQLGRTKAIHFRFLRQAFQAPSQVKRAPVIHRTKIIQSLLSSSHVEETRCYHSFRTKMDGALHLIMVRCWHLALKTDNASVGKLQYRGIRIAYCLYDCGRLVEVA